MSHALVLTDTSKKAPIVLALGVVALVCTGWLDFATGGDLAFQLVYLLVVCAVAWHTSLAWGVVTATLSGVVWTLALVPFRTLDQFPMVAANAVSRWIVFLASAYLVHRLHVTQAQLSRLNEKLECALERESSLARTDPVTGLFNRRGFTELAARELARVARSGEAIAIAYLDLDNFKALNDRYGHDRGDRCLSDVAQALSQTVRQTDVAARLGGDEFALLLPSTHDKDARVACQRVQMALRSALAPYRSARVSASIGLVIFERAPAGAADLLRQADAAMYAAKRGGKGRVHVVQGHVVPGAAQLAEELHPEA